MRAELIVYTVALALIFAGSVSVLVDDGTSGPLRVTYSNKVCYEPFMVAQALGLFEEVGVETVIMGGGSLSKEAVATRSADVGAMGDVPGIILVSMDTGTRVVCSYGSGEGMHRLVAIEGVVSVNDMVGRRVGVQAGSSSHGALLSWLSVNGIEGVEIVHMRPPDMVSALSTGQLDAFMASDPWPAIALDSVPGAHVLGDSSVCDNSFPLLICATERALAERGDDIRAMMSALEVAIDLIHDDPESAAALCAPLTGLDVGTQSDCMSRIGYAMHELDEGDIASLDSTAMFLVENSILSEAPSMGTLAVGGWVP